MIGIIIGLFIAFVTILRSFENVVTNKKIISKVDVFYERGNKYIEQIVESTYKTASENLLLKSIKYLIYLSGVLTFSSFLILALISEIENTNSKFAINESKYFIYFMGILFIIRFGTRYTFKMTLSLWKKELIFFLKGKKLWSYLILIETILIFYLLIDILAERYDLSNWLIFDYLLKKHSANDLTLILAYPIIFLLFIILIISLLFFLIWSFSKLLSFISFWFLKEIFKISIFLNDNKPLKPLLLIIQIIIIIITPIIVFTIRIFSN